MSQLAALRVHHSRADQVRLIAKARGLSIVETIERFIRSEIAAGTIPDALPGFEAKAEGKRVLVTIEERLLPPLAPRAATALADLIEMLATKRGRDAGMGMPMRAGGRLDIARKGTGILIRIVDPKGNAGETATLTFSMCADFCRALHSAALTAEFDA